MTEVSQNFERRINRVNNKNFNENLLWYDRDGLFFFFLTTFSLRYFCFSAIRRRIGLNTETKLVEYYINPSAAAATFSLQIFKNSIFHLLALNEIL